GAGPGQVHHVRPARHPGLMACHAGERLTLLPASEARGRSFRSRRLDPSFVEVVGKGTRGGLPRSETRRESVPGGSSAAFPGGRRSRNEASRLTFPRRPRFPELPSRDVRRITKAHRSRKRLIKAAEHSSTSYTDRS